MHSWVHGFMGAWVLGFAWLGFALLGFASVSWVHGFMGAWVHVLDFVCSVLFGLLDFLF